jgi:hypothetical protein
MRKQKGNADAANIVGIIILILIVIFWYVVIPVLIICLLSWLYIEGWKKTVKSIIALIVIIPLCGFTIAVGPHFWKDYQYKHSSEGIISDKEKHIQTMKHDLEKQLTNILGIRTKYRNDIGEFLREISEEKQKHGITSVASATERVRYNIELIRERDASLSKLADIEHITKNGYEETVYMLRQLDGAKGMAKIMVDGSSLANNAEIILKKYSSYTGVLAINPKDLTRKSPEAIWQEYVK